MSDLESQLGSILEKMVDSTVAEMTKVLGGSGSRRPEEETEDNEMSSEDKVRVYVTHCPFC